ncbi:hypothetical protein ETD83_10220 [Actinomadura soli]|uniref:Uncharacterized protein n=1 Tax=Actinomadura soli TaxID=2508997 RepID=A0A5C4JFG9_9ACTN|nr:hypothetical protein ETD83_10220 [Actinomadura soli]
MLRSGGVRWPGRRTRNTGGITGSRHALGGYQQVCGVMPDLTTFGKAMGNGYLIAGPRRPPHDPQGRPARRGRLAQAG